MRLFLSSLLLIAIAFYASATFASAHKPKPGQKSSTCYYNLGPKLGEEEDLKGKIKPVLIGKACTDGEGSSGIAVIDAEDEAKEEAEEAAKRKAIADKVK